MTLNQRISPSLSENLRNQQVQACSQRGFTLIELMIVIVILGILLAASNSAWTNYRESTKADVAKGQIVGLLQQARLRAISSGEKQTVSFDYVNNTAISATGAPFLFEGVDVAKYKWTTCSVLSDPTQNISFKRRGTGSGTSLIVASKHKAGLDKKIYFIRINGVTGRIKVVEQCP